MKNLKFILLVVMLLAAIPTIFFAQIKHTTPTIQDQDEQVLEQKKDNTISCGENYISMRTVTIAY